MGRDFLNFQCKAPGPLQVVYVDYQTRTKSLKQRYEAICRALGFTEVEQWFLKENLRIIEVRKALRQGDCFPRFPVKAKSPDEKNSLVWWQEFVKKHPADLYILDPLRCVHSQDENDSLMKPCSPVSTSVQRISPNRRPPHAETGQPEGHS